MAQIVIDVNGTPTLFSPVPAHALHRGDLIQGYAADQLGPQAVRVSRLAPKTRRGVAWQYVDGVTLSGTEAPMRFHHNGNVLRAVGANSGCGGSR